MTELAWHHSPQPPPPAATEAEYTRLVRTGVAAIIDKEVLKVVSSRAARRPLPVGFDPLTAFGELSRKYPWAFVSLVSVPGVGTWLGASPEVLAEVTADGQFHTVALAGTQPLVPDISSSCGCVSTTKPAPAPWWPASCCTCAPTSR